MRAELSTTPVNRGASVLAALLVGVLLAGLIYKVSGRLYALRMPSQFFALLSGHAEFAHFIRITLLVHGAAALLALAVGWGLFRLLRRHSFLLVAAASVPWLVYRAWNASLYFSESALPVLQKLGWILNWHTSPGLLGLPVGLWLAARLAAARASRASRA